MATTPQATDAPELTERCYRWLFVRDDGSDLEFCTLPPVTREQVRQRYPEAIYVYPLPDDAEPAAKRIKMIRKATR